MDILEIFIFLRFYKTGIVLTEISGKIQNAICEIGERIDEFEA